MLPSGERSFGRVLSRAALREMGRVAGAPAGPRIERFGTWRGATRPDIIDTFVSVELLPFADRLESGLRDRIAEERRTALAPFLGAGGAIVAHRHCGEPPGIGRP